MDYKHYTADDFILDEKFQDWVFHSTPALNYFWENFCLHHPEKSLELEEARRQLEVIQFYKHVPDDGMHQRIRNQLQAHVGTSASRQQSEPKNNHRHLYPYWVAASISLIILIGFGLWQISYKPSPKYHTSYAEIQEVWLPDSTLVVMNANSSITYTAYEEGPLREVWLEGEAFFDVTENKDRPFIVHVDEMDVRVTGTTFNVLDRQDKTQVVLASGQVILESVALAKPLQMKPGDLIAYDKSSGQVEQRVVVPNKYTAWRTRIYFFEDASLQEVAGVIETYYGQKVQLDPTISKMKFTATVTMHEEVDELLTLLSETFDLNITVNQNEIMIKKEKQ